MMLKNMSKKTVTWHPKGITEARLFVIEPWRKIASKPISSIKQSLGFASAPFALPLHIPTLKPYFDYNTWRPKPPTTSLTCCSTRPITRSMKTYTIPPFLTMTTSDDETVGGNETVYLPRSNAISLADIYKIAEELKNIDNYDKFISESEKTAEDMKTNK